MTRKQLIKRAEAAGLWFNLTLDCVIITMKPEGLGVALYDDGRIFCFIVNDTSIRIRTVTGAARWLGLPL